MGSYGIGVGRLLACLAEEYNDAKGLKLPISIAPYQVILIVIPDSDEITEIAEKVYNSLLDNNIEVIFDDRSKKSASPGEKFNDAELIGIPIRITISSKSIKNGGAELKLRNQDEFSFIEIEKIIHVVKEKIEIMFAELNKKLEVVEKYSE